MILKGKSSHPIILRDSEKTNSDTIECVFYQNYYFKEYSKFVILDMITKLLKC